MTEWDERMLEEIISKEDWAFLKKQMRERRTFLLAAEDEEDALSSLSTLMEMSTIDRESRVVYIERTPKLKQNPERAYAYIHEYHPSDGDPILQRDLIREAHRMKPDFIVLTDVVDGEAIKKLSDRFDYGFYGGATIKSPSMDESMKRLREFADQAEGKDHTELFEVIIQIEEDEDGEKKVSVKHPLFTS